MRTSGLPTVPRPRPWLALLIHGLNGTLAGVLAFALTSNAVALYHHKAGGITPLVASLALLLALEIALAGWLLMRARRIRQLVTGSRLSLRLGQAEDARRQLRELLGFLEYRANPSAVLYGLAVADAMEGDRESAIALLRQAGGTAAALELRIALCLRVGRTREAERLLPMLVGQRGNDPEVAALAAAVAQEAGRWETAKMLVDAGLARWPNSVTLKKAADALDRGESVLDVLVGY